MCLELRVRKTVILKTCTELKNLKELKILDYKLRFY